METKQLVDSHLKVSHQDIIVLPPNLTFYIYIYIYILLIFPFFLLRYKMTKRETRQIDLDEIIHAKRKSP